jgi:phosphohistidine phosphatase
MKRLFLLRHGKAVPAGGGSGDFDRTLMLSGMQEGALMARYIGARGYRIGLILCSAAARAAQTAELVQQQIHAPVVLRDNLYMADAPRLIAAVRGASAQIASLMIVGHNRGMEDCAVALADAPLGRAEQARHEAEEEGFPTCALAVLDFDVGRWRDVREGGGRLIDFMRPKDL